MARPNEPVGDFVAHRKTYESFLRLSTVATVWVLSIVVTLGIGGLTHRWWLAGFWLFVATIAALAGLAVKGLDWKPGTVVFVLMLLTLLLVTH